MNVIMNVRRYASLKDDVCPKYSVIDPRDEVLSGFSEQNAHL